MCVMGALRGNRIRGSGGGSSVGSFETPQKHKNIFLFTTAQLTPREILMSRSAASEHDSQKASEDDEMNGIASVVREGLDVLGGKSDLYVGREVKGKWSEKGMYFYRLSVEPVDLVRGFFVFCRSEHKHSFKMIVCDADSKIVHAEESRGNCSEAVMFFTAFDTFAHNSVFPLEGTSSTPIPGSSLLKRAKQEPGFAVPHDCCDTALGVFNALDGIKTSKRTISPGKYLLCLISTQQSLIARGDFTVSMAIAAPGKDPTVRELVNADAEVFKCRAEMQELKKGYLKAKAEYVSWLQRAADEEARILALLEKKDSCYENFTDASLRVSNLPVRPHVLHDEGGMRAAASAWFSRQLTMGKHALETIVASSPGQLTSSKSFSAFPGPSSSSESPPKSKPKRPFSFSPTPSALFSGNSNSNNSSNNSHNHGINAGGVANYSTTAKNEPESNFSASKTTATAAPPAVAVTTSSGAKLLARYIYNDDDDEEEPLGASVEASKDESGYISSEGEEDMIISEPNTGGQVVSADVTAAATPNEMHTGNSENESASSTVVCTATLSVSTPVAASKPATSSESSPWSRFIYEDEPDGEMVTINQEQACIVGSSPSSATVASIIEQKPSPSCSPKRVHWPEVEAVTEELGVQALLESPVPIVDIALNTPDHSTLPNNRMMDLAAVESICEDVPSEAAVSDGLNTRHEENAIDESSAQSTTFSAENVVVVEDNNAQIHQPEEPVGSEDKSSSMVVDQEVSTVAPPGKNNKKKKNKGRRRGRSTSDAANPPTTAATVDEDAEEEVEEEPSASTSVNKFETVLPEVVAPSPLASNPNPVVLESTPMEETNGRHILPSSEHEGGEIGTGLDDTLNNSADFTDAVEGTHTPPESELAVENAPQLVWSAHPAAPDQTPVPMVWDLPSTTNVTSAVEPADISASTAIPLPSVALNVNQLEKQPTLEHVTPATEVLNTLVTGKPAINSESSKTTSTEKKYETSATAVDKKVETVAPVVVTPSKQTESSSGKSSQKVVPSMVAALESRSASKKIPAEKNPEAAALMAKSAAAFAESVKPVQTPPRPIGYGNSQSTFNSSFTSGSNTKSQAGLTPSKGSSFGSSIATALPAHSVASDAPLFAASTWDSPQSTTGKTLPKADLWAPVRTAVQSGTVSKSNGWDFPDQPSSDWDFTSTTATNGNQGGVWGTSFPVLTPSRPGGADFGNGGAQINSSSSGGGLSSGGFAGIVQQVDHKQRMSVSPQPTGRGIASTGMGLASAASSSATSQSPANVVKANKKYLDMKDPFDGL